MVTEDQLDTIRDFRKFAPKFLSIRTKSGEKRMFQFNRAQMYLHERLQAQKEATGKVRALVLKGRQQGCCWSENMQVLTADYRWLRIGDVKIGDRLVACDENPQKKSLTSRKPSRKFRTAIVEDKREFFKEAYEVCLDNGARLEVTGDHRMLSKKRGGDDQQWRHIEDFQIGDVMRVVARPPQYQCQTYEDGWMAGIIDGEGSHRGATGAKRLSIHQVQGKILDRVKSYLNQLDIPYCEVIDRRTKCGQLNKLGDKPVHRIDIHRLPYLMEIFARCRPTRFTDKEWHVGHELPGKATQDGIRPWAQVISIKPIGKMKVIDLQTSEKTFICEGLVSHNSTYIQARYFHQVITSRGKQAFILTHDKEATKNLFGMTQRFYDNLDSGLAPKADTSNAKELYFKDFDSGYAVGTAGNKSVGRGQTIQLLHASEVAYWSFAEEHSKGILQAISNEKNTEIIMESTANGIGNYFHQRWLSAMSGSNEYQAIFLPWYWQDEYVYNADNFIRTDEEDHLFAMYGANGLTNEHLAWRRIKIAEFSKDYDAGREHFNVEYPMNSIEAFKNPIHNVFINSKYVDKARKNDVDPVGSLIIGVDVAISDRDRTAIIRRKGRHSYNLERFQNYNTMEICGRLKRIIIEEKPFKMYIDCIGIGAGVVDRLNEMGFDCVEGVNVARSANDKERFKNLRAELWSDMRDYLYNELPVQIPDEDTLHGELCSLGFKENSSGQLQIESKDDLRARGLPSPDGADALSLTFFGGMYGSQSHHVEVDRLAPFERQMFR